MKMRISLLAITAALGLSVGQTMPANPQTQDQQKPTQTQTNAKTNSTTGSTNPAEMKSTTFKGVLVDMSCASRSSGSAATAQSGMAAPAPSSAAVSDQVNSANRSAGDSGTSCPVSSSSSEFGMKLDDGRVVRFDLVGNERAKEALKNEKGLGKDLSANKPLHAKVNGVMVGDQLIVASIH